MTVATQVKQTIASLKGVQSTLETFASIEENQKSKAAYHKGAERIKLVVKDMEQRLSVLEFEEPQYKGF